jgi:hypothetical protein
MNPNFKSALRGLWLFTWKPQLSWRRIPVVTLTLLVLPLLVVLTTSPREVWSRHYSLFGYPQQQVSELIRRMARLRPPLSLTADQRQQLQKILAEEFERTENEWREAQSPDMTIEVQTAQVEACFQRIRQRAEKLFDDQQLQVFINFQNRRLTQIQERLQDQPWSRTGPFYHWLIDFYFFVLLPLNCVRVCGALIRDEIQTNTLGFLTTRPVSRAKLLFAKYLTQTAWLQIVLFLETLLLFAAGNFRQIPSLGTLLPLFLAVQFLAVFAWCALGAFLGQITNRYMAMGLVYGFIVEMGIGRIPTNINTLSIIRHLKTLLAHDSGLHNIYQWSSSGIALSLGAVILAAVLFLGLALMLFSIKEYHHSAEMQK